MEIHNISISLVNLMYRFISTKTIFSIFLLLITCFLAPHYSMYGVLTTFSPPDSHLDSDLFGGYGVPLSSANMIHGPGLPGYHHPHLQHPLAANGPALNVSYPQSPSPHFGRFSGISLDLNIV